MSYFFLPLSMFLLLPLSLSLFLSLHLLLFLFLFLLLLPCLSLLQSPFLFLLQLLLICLPLHFLWHANHLIPIGLFTMQERWRSHVLTVEHYIGNQRNWSTHLKYVQSSAYAA